MEESTSLRSAAGPAEQQLVDLAKANDAAAWTEIYERYQPVIYRYVKARIFDDTAAEDATSSVFVAAVKSMKTYRHAGKPLLAWLYGIARNIVAEHQRQAAKERERRWLPFGSASASPRDTEAALPQGEARGIAGSGIDWTDLEDALTRLGDAQREVIILRYFVGLTTDEITATLGRKPAAVYSLEARALQAMRNQLAD